MSVRFLAPVLGTLLLAACAGPAPESHNASNPPVSTVAAGAAMMAPMPTVAELSAHPERFDGMSKRQILAALGAPSFLRRESPAEIWQYYGASCVLDLFLYDDSGEGKVAHAEIRNLSSGSSEARPCLGQVFDRRAARATS